MDLTIDRLTKQFGSKIAVDRVSTRLTPGVYGLLGANGAGKTTLMRMVCDVLRPTSGEIRFDGRDSATSTAPGWATFRRTLATTPTSRRSTSCATWRRSRGSIAARRAAARSRPRGRGGACSWKKRSWDQSS